MMFDASCSELSAEATRPRERANCGLRETESFREAAGGLVKWQSTQFVELSLQHLG